MKRATIPSLIFATTCCLAVPFLARGGQPPASSGVCSTIQLAKQHLTYSVRFLSEQALATTDLHLAQRVTGLQAAAADWVKTVEGMIAYPDGSGPMNETNRQVRPPSVVRAQNGRPSRPFSFDADRNSRQSAGPFTT